MSKIQPQKFGIKEVADVTFYDQDNKPVLFFDSLKMVNQEHSGETTYARGGRGNPKLIGWNYNREVTFNMQDALLSQKTMALLAGTEVETGATITVFEELVLDESLEADLTKLPDGGTPTFLAVYIEDDEDIEVVDTAGDTAISYAFSEGTITLTNGASVVTSAAEGDTLIVSYTYESATATKVVFNSDDYPGTYKIVGDSVIRNSNGVDVAYQTVVYKAKLMPGFTIEMTAEGDPSVFDFAIDVMEQDGGKGMIEYIQY